MENMKNNCVNQISNKETIHQIIGLAIKHRKIMQNYLDETGVYQAQHHLLMKISHNQNASQKDLARSMDVSAATIAVSLKKLEKGGYIKKEMDKGDNRLNQITITDKGNKVVEQSKQIFDSTHEKVFEGLTEEEKYTLSALLQKMYTNLVRMEDEINRMAQIEKVTGIAYIQKGNGAKSFRAYEGIILSHGDHIKTEANSSVVFKTLDQRDQITIDEKSQVCISDLRNESGSKKTRFSIFSGSIWTKASSLISTKDEFEIETPTAFMDIQGTTLLVGVDPATGESNFFIASGLGMVNGNTPSGTGSGTPLLPSQQITLYGDTFSGDYDDLTNIANLDGLISNTSNSIIEAIISSKATMDQENEQYLARLQSERDGAGEGLQADLDRITQNLDNLIGNIVNAAIRQNLVDESAIRTFINAINQQLDKKLNLDTIKAPVLSEEEKAKQAQIKLQEEERKRKEEAEKQKQEELKKQNEALLKKLQDQLEKQKEEKKKAEEAARKKAEEEHAKKAKEEMQNQAPPSPSPDTDDDDDSDKPSQNPPQIDTTPPTLSLISPTAPLSSNVTNQQILVRAEQNATVTMAVYGDTILATGVGLGLSMDVALYTGELSEGIYNFTVRAKDATGNISTVEIPPITIDTTPPDFEYDIEYIDDYTRQFYITTSEIDTTVKLFEVFEDESEEPLDILVEETSEGKTVTVSLLGLPPGGHVLRLKLIDSAGNETYYDVSFDVPSTD